jgi:hypothetical protein
MSTELSWLLIGNYHSRREMHTKFKSENLNLEDLGIDDIILKWVLKGNYYQTPVNRVMNLIP